MHYLTVIIIIIAVSRLRTVHGHGMCQNHPLHAAVPPDKFMCILSSVCAWYTAKIDLSSWIKALKGTLTVSFIFSGCGMDYGTINAQESLYLGQALGVSNLLAMELE